MDIQLQNEIRQREHLARHDLWYAARCHLLNINRRVLAPKGEPLAEAMQGIHTANGLLNGLRWGLCSKLDEDFETGTAARIYGNYPHELPHHVPADLQHKPSPVEFHEGLAGPYHRFAKNVYALARRIERDWNRTTPIVPEMFNAIGSGLLALRGGLESLIPLDQWNGPDGERYRQLYVVADLGGPVDPPALLTEREAETLLGLPLRGRRVVEE